MKGRLKMNKLIDKVHSYNRELRDGLQEIFNELNKGQTKKVLQNGFRCAIIFTIMKFSKGDVRKETGNSSRL